MEWKRAVRNVRPDVSDSHFKLEWRNFRVDHDAISSRRIERRSAGDTPGDRPQGDDVRRVQISAAPRSPSP